MDVWKPDVAQLFRAASPATPRTDVAAFLSPSTLSITQALRKHFWGDFAAGPTQGFFPLWESSAPEGVPRSGDRASPHPQVPTLRWSLHAPGAQAIRLDGLQGRKVTTHKCTASLKQVLPQTRTPRAGAP